MSSLCETEKVNLKFIDLVKKYPCIWNRDAQNYNQKWEMDAAWNEIAKHMGEKPKICLKHWQTIQRAYSRSFRLNSDGTCEKSEYYMSSALEFLRPHLKASGALNRESFTKDKNKITKDPDDSRTSITEIEIKDEPADSNRSTTHTESEETMLFEIMKMKEEEDFNKDENQIADHKSEAAMAKSSSSSKRKREANPIEVNKTKEAKGEGDKNFNPNSCLIEANRKFFESLIPFIDDMNTQQNRRFRREIMCLIDDVLDDRDINGGQNSSS